MARTSDTLTIEIRVDGRWAEISPLQLEVDDAICSLDPQGRLVWTLDGETVLRVTGRRVGISCEPLSRLGVEGTA